MAFRSEKLAQHTRAHALEHDNRRLAAANADLTKRLDCWRHAGREEDFGLSSLTDRVWRGLLWTVPMAVVIVIVASLALGVFHFGEPNVSVDGLRNVLWLVEHDPVGPLVFGAMALMSLLAAVACLAAPTVAMAVRSRLPWSLRAATVMCLVLLWVPTTWAVLARIQELREARRYAMPVALDDASRAEPLAEDAVMGV